jgi:hypothetical protein
MQKKEILKFVWYTKLNLLKINSLSLKEMDFDFYQTTYCY